MTIEERNKLVEDNLDLVDWTLLHKLSINCKNPFYEDYQQEGRIGLIYAANTFNDSMAQFSTYAVTCIWHRVSRVKYDVPSALHVPAHLSTAIPIVLPLLNEGLSFDEISAKSGIPLYSVQLIDNIFNQAELDAPLDEGEDITLLSTIEDKKTSNFADTIIENSHISQCIESVINSFRSKWAREFVREYFNDTARGINLSLEDYGAKYGKTRQRCSMVMQQAKDKFKLIYERD